MKKGGDSLAGKMEAAKGRFKLLDGVLIVDPKVKGDIIIETAKEYGKDLTIRFEYKPGKGCNNDLFLRGTKLDIKTPNIKNLKQDEWNEIPKLSFKAQRPNSRTMGRPEKTLNTKVEKSTFGIRAEIGPIEIRKLRIKETQ